MIYGLTIAIRDILLNFMSSFFKLAEHVLNFTCRLVHRYAIWTFLQTEKYKESNQNLCFFYFNCKVLPLTCLAIQWRLAKLKYCYNGGLRVLPAVIGSSLLTWIHFQLNQFVSLRVLKHLHFFFKIVQKPFAFQCSESVVI